MNLKIALIGCGNIAQKHIRYICRYVDKSHIAICDRDSLRLEEFAKANGIEKSFTDVGVMLAQFKPDVTHILTPPNTHKDLAVTCLERGSHILIEKPMCLSVQEAEEIIKISQKKKLLVCVDHMRLFDPLLIKARQLLDSGIFGSIVNMNVGYSYDFLQKMNTDSAIRWLRDLPGGTFFDVIPHPLCILEEFIPGLEVEKSILIQNQEGLITELLAIFRSSSATATLHMSLNVFPLKNYVEFECNKAVIRVDFRNFLITIRRFYHLPNVVERIIGNLSVAIQIFGNSIGSIFDFLLGRLDSYAGLDYIIEHFYKAITEDRPCPVSAEKAKRLLELTQVIFQDLETKPEVFKQSIPLKKADVLVTGATGFIGRRLVKRLLEKNYKVRILTHRNISQQERLLLFNGEVEVLQADIYNYPEVEKACEGVSIVYHLAAAMKGDWNYHLDTTITGSNNILRAAQKMGVRHLVYVSTLNVYDASSYPSDGIIDEDFAYEQNPSKRGFYSHAKLRAEKIVRQFADKDNMSISIVRPGLVYGPGRPSFLKDAGIRVGKRIVIVLGSGWRRIPLVYVDNLVDALVMAAENAERARGIFNVVDREYPNQRQFISTYQKLSNQRLIAIYVPYFLVYLGYWMIERIVALIFRKQVTLCYRLNCINKNVKHTTARIEERLGWRQRVNFEQGLRLTIEDERRNVKGQLK